MLASKWERTGRRVSTPGTLNLGRHYRRGHPLPLERAAQMIDVIRIAAPAFWSKPA